MNDCQLVDQQRQKWWQRQRERQRKDKKSSWYLIHESIQPRLRFGIIDTCCHLGLLIRAAFCVMTSFNQDIEWPFEHLLEVGVNANKNSTLSVAVLSPSLLFSACIQDSAPRYHCCTPRRFSGEPWAHRAHTLRSQHAYGTQPAESQIYHLST